MSKDTERADRIVESKEQIVKALGAIDKPCLSYGYDGPYRWRNGQIIRDAIALINRLTADLAAKDKEIAQMQEAQRWIPVTERPPEASDGEWVAFTLPSYFLPGASSCRTSRYFSDSGWCNKEIERATHWMPLPPKGE